MSQVFRCLLVLCLGLVLPLRSQDAPSDAPLTPPQVDQLLGPIALYPDALIALILPASTTPGDIVLVQRYLAAGGDPGQVDSQPWNESVRALARYPMLIKWLDENLTWTQQLGQTFINQPDEVMTAVQRLRTRAKASGALTSTAQQKLVLDGDIIEIVPAQPDVIYVPYYDPNVVYGGLPPGYYYDRPYLTFGIGLPIGFWLSYDFNWRQRTVWVGDRHHNWREYPHGDWNHHYGESGHSTPGNWRRWQPPANRPPYARPSSLPTRSEPYRPAPLPGSPTYPPHDARPRSDSHDRDFDHARPPAPTNYPAPRPDSGDHHASRPAPAVPPSTPHYDTGNRHDPHPASTTSCSPPGNPRTWWPSAPSSSRRGSRRHPV